MRPADLGGKGIGTENVSVPRLIFYVYMEWTYITTSSTTNAAHHAAAATTNVTVARNVTSLAAVVTSLVSTVRAVASDVSWLVTVVARSSIYVRNNDHDKFKLVGEPSSLGTSRHVRPSYLDQSRRRHAVHRTRPCDFRGHRNRRGHWRRQWGIRERSGPSCCICNTSSCSSSRLPCFLYGEKNCDWSVTFSALSIPWYTGLRALSQLKKGSHWLVQLSDLINSQAGGLAREREELFS